MNIAYLLHTPPTANSIKGFQLLIVTVNTPLAVTYTNNIVNNSLEMPE
jgi:hypothetical protein